MNELRNTFFFFWAKKNTKKSFGERFHHQTKRNQGQSTHTSEKTKIRFLHAFQSLLSAHTIPIPLFLSSKHRYKSNASRKGFWKIEKKWLFVWIVKPKNKKKWLSKRKENSSRGSRQLFEVWYVLPPKITSNTKKHYYMHPNANNPRRPPALGYTFMSLLSLVQEY
jgi:hypothetical protein